MFRNRFPIIIIGIILFRSMYGLAQSNETFYDSFEIWENNKPLGWYAGVGVVLNRSSEIKQSGIYGGTIVDVHGVSDAYIRTLNYMNVTEIYTYKVNLYVFDSSSNYSLKITAIVYDNLFTYQKTIESASSKASNYWQILTFVVNIPDNGYYIKFNIGVSDSSTGDFDGVLGFDDFSLVLIDKLPPNPVKLFLQLSLYVIVIGIILGVFFILFQLIRKTLIKKQRKMEN